APERRWSAAGLGTSATGSHPSARDPMMERAAGRPTGATTMTQPGVVPERLAHAAASWAQIAAGHVPPLPVRPATSASYPAHVIATVCVEVVQPLTGLAARWTDDGSTSVLGRVDIRIRHLESAEKKIGRDLGIAAAAAETRALLSELGVRSTAAK